MEDLFGLRNVLRQLHNCQTDVEPVMKQEDFSYGKGYLKALQDAIEIVENEIENIKTTN